MRASRIKLTLAIVACVALLVGVLTPPLIVRKAVWAYDLAPEDQPDLKQAVLLLGQSAIPTIIERSLSSPCQSRQRLVKLLRTEHSNVAFGAFSNALKEHHPERQVNAARALGYLGDNSAIPILESTFCTDHPALKKIVGQAIHQIEVSTSHR